MNDDFPTGDIEQVPDRIMRKVATFSPVLDLEEILGGQPTRVFTARLIPAVLARIPGKQAPLKDDREGKPWNR